MHLYIYPILTIAALGLAACGERTEVASNAKPAAAAAAANTPAAAALADGIAFAQPSYPAFVASTEGISQPEPFGRWTDGPKAGIEFMQPLPRKFDLVVQGAAFGPNIGQPVKVTIGQVTQVITFASDLTQGAETRRLRFALEQPASRIEFAIPRPTRPSNGDVRELGLALVALKIEPAAN